MLVEFKNKSEILQEKHSYTLLGIRDGVAKFYDPHGKYVFIPENNFYENLSELDISFNENRMPEIKPELKPHEKIRFWITTWRFTKMARRCS